MTANFALQRNKPSVVVLAFCTDLMVPKWPMYDWCHAFFSEVDCIHKGRVHAGGALLQERAVKMQLRVMKYIPYMALRYAWGWFIEFPNEASKAVVTNRSVVPCFRLRWSPREKTQHVNIAWTERIDGLPDKAPKRTSAEML